MIQGIFTKRQLKTRIKIYIIIQSRFAQLKTTSFHSNSSNSSYLRSSTKIEQISSAQTTARMSFDVNIQLTYYARNLTTETSTSSASHCLTCLHRTSVHQPQLGTTNTILRESLLDMNIHGNHRVVFSIRIRVKI